MDARGKFGEQERSVRVARGAAESNTSFLSCFFVSKAVTSSFSKSCVFQFSGVRSVHIYRIHENGVFKNFYSGERFQKVAFSKLKLRFHRIHADGRPKREKKTFSFTNWERILMNGATRKGNSVYY